jgi:hypothetical protein
VTTTFIAGLPGEDAASIRSWMREVADPGFPSHRKMLFPLALSNENPLDIWASAIERDPGRFGYRITGPLGSNAGSFARAEWESGTMDFQQARLLAAEFVALCRRSPCRADVFSHMLLMGYGFSHEQLMRADIFDPAWIREVDARVAMRVAEYRRLITPGSGSSSVSGRGSPIRRSP